MKGSGIDLGLTKANLVSINADELQEFHYRNTSSKGFSGSSKTNTTVTDIQKAGGGWRCHCSLNPEFAQQKPNTPVRIWDNKTQKDSEVKYLTPVGVKNSILLPAVTAKIARKIADRNRVSSKLPAEVQKLSDDDTWAGFWDWTFNDARIDLYITEGAKKACAMLSLGYATIAVTGIYGGVTRKVLKKGFKNKVHALTELFDRGIKYKMSRQKQEIVRNITIVFDNDSKLGKAKNVMTATITAAEQLSFKGCNVKAASWRGDSKGIDDLIVNEGASAASEVLDNALPWQDYLFNFRNDLSLYPGYQEINTRYVGYSLDVIDDTAFLTCLKSPKDTGKTSATRKLFAKHVNDEHPALVIAHTISLLEDLSKNLSSKSVKIRYIGSGADGSRENLALTLYSLHQRGKAQFNPEIWRGAIVFIDEVEQFLNALFHSSIAKDRATVIANLKRLCQVIRQTGGKLIIADADLSSRAVDFFRDICRLELRDDKDQKVIDGIEDKMQIIDNKPQMDKAKAIFYRQNNATEVVLAAADAVRRGEKAFIQTCGKAANSRFGTRNLFRMFEILFPNLKGLRLDSETIRCKDDEADKATRNITETLEARYDYVIASNVIGTGVSIKDKEGCERLFDVVFVIGQGNLSPDGLAQFIERYRTPVDRHIWLNVRAKGMNGKNNRKGKTSKNIAYSLHSAAKKSLEQAKSRGVCVEELLLDLGEYQDNPSVKAASVGIEMINYQYSNYVEYFQQKLKADGYTLVDSEGLEKDEFLATAEDLLDSDESIKEAVQAMVDTELIDYIDYELIEQKETKEISLTRQEQLQKERYNLYNKLGLGEDAEIVHFLEYYNEPREVPKTKKSYLLLDENANQLKSYLENSLNPNSKRDRLHFLDLADKDWQGMELFKSIGADQLLQDGLELTTEDIILWRDKQLALKAADRKALGFNSKRTSKSKLIIENLIAPYGFKVNKDGDSYFIHDPVKACRELIYSELDQRELDRLAKEKAQIEKEQQAREELAYFEASVEQTNESTFVDDVWWNGSTEDEQAKIEANQPETTTINHDTKQNNDYTEQPQTTMPNAAEQSPASHITPESVVEPSQQHIVRQETKSVEKPVRSTEGVRRVHENGRPKVCTEARREIQRRVFKAAVETIRQERALSDKSEADFKAYIKQRPDRKIQWADFDISKSKVLDWFKDFIEEQVKTKQKTTLPTAADYYDW